MFYRAYLKVENKTVCRCLFTLVCTVRDTTVTDAQMFFQCQEIQCPDVQEDVWLDIYNGQMSGWPVACMAICQANSYPGLSV